MKRKLFASAIASVLAASGALVATCAQAQVTLVAPDKAQVTLSGFLKGTFGQFSAGNRVGSGNSSEMVLKDEASRLILTMRGEISDDLSGIGRLDLRGSAIDTGTFSNIGESYVGLTSPTRGTLTFGRHDLHYSKHASFTGVHGGLMTNPNAVFDVAGRGAFVIAGRTRTPNVVRYGSPKFGGMGEIALAYSTSGTTTSGNEADFGSNVRKGSAWNVAPTLWGKNYEAGFSYWKDKPDASTREDTGMSLYGWMTFGGLRVGLAWNRSEVEVGGAPASERDTYGIPINFSAGPHNVYFDYYVASKDDVIPGATGATFWGLTYAYDLSKRTAVALSYNMLKNDTAAAYNLLSPPASISAGEDPRMLGVTLTHRF